mmetsp:Transcript_14214/g.16175  ORF Transcript_14214/g.16175 Transcript_14214/m.16175 type:complete len:290 (-) Transcript_14214:1614-2483(-)
MVNLNPFKGNKDSKKKQQEQLVKLIQIVGTLCFLILVAPNIVSLFYSTEAKIVNSITPAETCPKGQVDVNEQFVHRGLEFNRRERGQGTSLLFCHDRQNENNCKYTNVDKAWCVKTEKGSHHWICTFDGDTQEGYKIGDDMVRCTEVGNLECTPCSLTYSVKKLNGRGSGVYTPWFSGPYRSFDFELETYHYAIVAILGLIFIPSIIDGFLSQSKDSKKVSKKSKGRRKIPKGGRSPRRKQLSLSSDSSDDDLDTDDEVERFIEDLFSDVSDTSSESSRRKTRRRRRRY